MSDPIRVYPVEQTNGDAGWIEFVGPTEPSVFAAAAKWTSENRTATIIGVDWTNDCEHNEGWGCTLTVFYQP